MKYCHRQPFVLFFFSYFHICNGTRFIREGERGSAVALPYNQLWGGVAINSHSTRDLLHRSGLYQKSEWTNHVNILSNSKKCLVYLSATKTKCETVQESYKFTPQITKDNWNSTYLSICIYFCHWLLFSVDQNKNSLIIILYVEKSA